MSGMKKSRFARWAIAALALVVALGLLPSVTMAEDTGTTADATVASDTTDAPAEASLYDQLMAAETAEDMDSLLGDASEEDVSAFTSEQLADLTEKANAFEDSDAKTSVLAMLDSLTNEDNKTAEVADANAKSSIVFKHIQTPNDDVSIGNDGTVDGHGWNVMKYSIVLVNLDGSVSYDLPEGSVVPDTYTFNSTTVDMSTALTQMGLSIPGYTLKSGYAFFWWTRNYTGPMYKVPYVQNFGTMNSGFKDVYHSYLGFQGLLGSVTGSGTQAGYDAYMNATFASSSEGDGGYSADSSYYAYNPTGTLRIVFFQVSDKTKYKSHFVDAYDPSGTGANQTTVDSIDMTMTKNGGWNQGTETYQWYGTLASVTDKTPAGRAGYTFEGWYTSKDKNGNGTGTKVTQASDDATHYNQDAYYYARWVPITYKLTLSKTVSGGAANKGERFTFTVSGLTAGTKYPVDYNSTTSGCATVHANTVTANDDGAVTLSLKHGETATINDVPYGANVTIAESATNAYTPSYKVNDATTATSGNSCKVDDIKENTTVAFTNSAELVPDLGIVTNYGPMIGLLAVGIVGALALSTTDGVSKWRGNRAWKE